MKYIYEKLVCGECLNLCCEVCKLVYQFCEVVVDGCCFKGIIKNISVSGVMVVGFDFDN